MSDASDSGSEASFRLSESQERKYSEASEKRRAKKAAEDAAEKAKLFSNSPLSVPGFGWPVDVVLNERRFAHGVDDFRQDRLVVREIAMLALMDGITDKPGWERKVFDEGIVGKWRAEALGMRFLSERAWEWCLRELRGKVEGFAERRFVTTLETGSLCAKGDELVGEELRRELIDGVRPLLDVEGEEKDWHPNSDEKVLNLVHPSLFPLVYGRTQVLQNGQVGVADCLDYCGKGTVISALEALRYIGGAGGMKWSTRFQWLPAEVKFTGSSGQTDVEFTSYINNLHPIHRKDLYSTISKITGKAIPMWNEVLVLIDQGFGESRVPPRIKVWSAQVDPQEAPEHLHCLADDEDDEGWEKDLASVQDYLALPDHPDYNASEDDAEDEKYKNGTWKDETDADLHQAVNWKLQRLRKVSHPEPGDAFSYDDWKSGTTDQSRVATWGGEDINLQHDYYTVNLEQDFRDKGLQVIVKLASVELTPEKPTYEGGNWHLEGMMNEHIVATAIYYYDVDNVTDSLLDFRMEAQLDDSELNYEQDDHQPLAEVFGTESMRGEPAIQNLGSLKCTQGRMLAFPNTLQHRVRPFQLADPSRAGHRRFLVLWLVDPHYRVTSTANVPPQQHDWVAPETIDRVLAGRDLAVELEDMIKEYTDDYPMGLETAEQVRLKLMGERTKLMPAVENSVGEYNLCEH